ncbi:hypothetical protein [Pinirhizobacter sp.]|jgi:hypothetical protein|uniref:hypothetical protein n=1 Tax=Pinirhizobacter sp. TaxID=2950432 RepID=UPI002F3FE85C
MMAAFVALFLVVNACELLFGQTHRPMWEWAQIFLLLVVVFAGHIYLAIGSSQASELARVLSLIAGVLYLFLFPVGTVVGAFLIYKCRTPWQELNPRATQVVSNPTDNKPWKGY